MEHRLDNRNVTDITVTLHLVANSLGDFRMTNLSAGGACVADPQQLLRVGDFVRAIFLPEHIVTDSTQANLNEHTPECVMEGLVVHTGLGQAGIMWASLSSDCEQLLPGLLAA